jgi:hypothetical protein
MRLIRRFGRPPLEPGEEVLLLRMDQVAGIHSLLLNGQPVAEVSPETTHYEFRIGPGPGRNVLVLDVEPPLPPSAAAQAPAEWGWIALVIQPIDRASPPVSS